MKLNLEHLSKKYIRPLMKECVYHNILPDEKLIDLLFPNIKSLVRSNIIIYFFYFYNGKRERINKKDLIWTLEKARESEAERLRIIKRDLVL